MAKAGRLAEISEDGELTPQIEEFCRQYIIDKNATKAAIRAKYSAKTAGSQASRLLKNVKVQELIKSLIGQQAKRTGITADRVLEEMEYLAMFDPIELVDVKSAQDIKKLKPEVRRAIVGWKYDKYGNFILMLAKQASLEMLGRHHQIFNDKLKVEVIDHAEIIRKARERAKAQS